MIGPGRTLSYRIDSSAGSVRIVQPGEYRISMLRGDRERQIELAVVRGAAEVFSDQGTTPVRAGERAYASAGFAPSYTYAYNSANWDDFDRWSEARRDVRLGVSAQYLPGEMRSYAPVLDEYGDWRYAQPYGYVWYPRVAVGWRPYYYGRWFFYPRYGWTWVGIDRFGWPTHHYGRWGFSSGSWFWIPGAVWSPAWVSWAYAPGYVSWCPLGFDNRAIFAINLNIVNINRYHSPWNAWTVVAAPHFGYGYVHQRVIAVDRVFDSRSRPVFVQRSSQPAFRDVAVPRNSVPIQWAGSRSTGRDTYFTRDSVRRDHAVDRGSGEALPAPSRTPRDIPVIRGASPQPSAPRAVPRGSSSESAAPGAPIRGPRDAGIDRGVRQDRIGSPTPGPVAVPRTAPAGPVRRVSPGEDSSMARERVMNREPRRVERYQPPPSIVREPPVRQPSVDYARPPMNAPVAPGRVEGREYARPGMAVPRAYEPRMAEPRAVEPRQAPPGRVEMREPPPPRHEAPPSRVEGRSAPPERAAPREGARSAPSQSAPPPRRGRGN